MENNKNGRVRKTCRDCGREFFGWPTRVRCTVCDAGKKTDDSKERELSDEKDGWRHMLRDATGTVIVPGGNVMNALDDLCAYEEACEAAGIHGPEELRKALELQKRGTTSSGPAGHLPLKGKALERNADGEIVYSCRFCGSCGHFVRESENRGGTAGHCDSHPRMRRSEGGRRGKLVPVPGEFRHVVGAREACRKWTAREKQNEERKTEELGSPANRNLPDGKEKGRQIAGATGE